MAKIYTFAIALLTFALASHAAIPVRWTTDAYKVKPLVYECYHGETLDLAAALTAYGEPLDFAGKTAKLYWQTNGMDQAWWSTNATVRAEAGVTNILAAIWSGAYDTGSESVIGFIGVEGENYRAAFQLNFRASPGFVPNQMPIPTKMIDWATVANVNVESAPFVVKGGAGGVTLQQVTNVANDRIDAKVADWAMKPNPPPQSGTDTNAVISISSTQITNSVLEGYLCTVEAAQAMTNALPAWTKRATKPTYTASEVGALPTSWATDSSSVFYGTANSAAYLGSNMHMSFISLVRLPGPITFGDFTTEKISWLQPDDSPVVTSNMMNTVVSSTSVTNLGAVVAATNAAKAYADGKFLGKTEQAADSEKLEGKTFTQTTNAAVTAANEYADGKFLPMVFNDNHKIEWVDDGFRLYLRILGYCDFYEDVYIKNLTIDSPSELGFDGIGTLPEYLANGTWNTASDPFAKVSQILQPDWTQTNTSAKDYIKNKPTLATVATSGSYTDLSNKPTIPAAQVNSDWNAESGVAQILNKPTALKNPNALTFAGTASGSYDGSSALTVTIPEGMSATTATNIANAVVEPTSNVVFNTETYFALNDGDLELVSNSNLVFQGAYELTNYTASVTTNLDLYYGQIARMEMTDVATNIEINLKFPSGAQKSGDAMLRLSTPTNGVISVVGLNGGSAFTIQGPSGWNEVDAGQYLFSFTKTAVTNGVSEIWIGRTKSEL